jgi:hypothetical protein
MEAEILAATSLLVEGIMVKQFLQFLLGDSGGLGDNQQVQVRLRLDSTSAQSFFSRLGPGRVKHLHVCCGANRLREGSGFWLGV